MVGWMDSNEFGLAVLYTEMTAWRLLTLPSSQQGQLAWGCKTSASLLSQLVSYGRLAACYLSVRLHTACSVGQTSGDDKNFLLHLFCQPMGHSIFEENRKRGKESRKEINASQVSLNVSKMCPKKSEMLQNEPNTERTFAGYCNVTQGPYRIISYILNVSTIHYTVEHHSNVPYYYYYYSASKPRKWSDVHDSDSAHMMFFYKKSLISSIILLPS